MKVYLDASDFMNLYKCPSGSKMSTYRDRIIELVDDKKIVVPVTSPILAEVLQPTDEEQFADRIERARFLNRISNGSCLPFFTDLISGRNLDGKKSWMPVTSLERFSFSYLIDGMRKKILRHPDIPRHERRRLSSPKVFRDEVLKNPALLSGFDDPWQRVPFLRKFIEGNYWRKALTGEIPLNEADEALQEWFTDYEALFRLLHSQEEERLLLQNLFSESDQIFHDIMTTIRDANLAKRQAEQERSAAKARLKKALEATGANSRTIRNFLKKLHYESPTNSELANQITREIKSDLEEMELFEIFKAYLEGILEGRKPIYSDFRDINHALYINKVDLWRGDKKFSNVLISRAVKGYEKIVPTIEELDEILKGL